MKLISVQMFGNPSIITRTVLPNEDVKDKNKKPFKATKSAALKIEYEEDNEIKSLTLTNSDDYKYDGATIPFGIGKGDMRLLIPAMWHDIMCENKILINFNRKLSSLVFKELLIQCHISKIKAQTMYLAVDNFQKLRKGWK